MESAHIAALLLLLPCWARASQPDDVQFTNIKCDPGDPLRYHAIPGDDGNYWQCGPGGFYWTLPCAPGSKFSQEHQACVWQGDGPIPPELRSPQIPPTPVFSVHPGQELRQAVGVNRWGQAGSDAANTSGAQIPWYLKEEDVRVSRNPIPADPWYVSGPYRGESVFSPGFASGLGSEPKLSQPAFNEVEKQKRQPSNVQEKVTPPAQPVIIPFLALPPPGPATQQPNYEDAWAEWPPISADAFGAPVAQAHTARSPRPTPLPHFQPGPPQQFQGPPPGQFHPPPPFRPPHIPDEPPPPVRLFKGCVENDTCPFGETSLEIYCYYEGDDTKYYQCSPHSDHGGLWVIRRCPGGLVFVGDRCDRAKRTSTNPDQVELKPSELEYEYIEYEVDLEPEDYKDYYQQGGQEPIATFIIPPDAGSPEDKGRSVVTPLQPSRPLPPANTRSQEVNESKAEAEASLKQTQTKLDLQRQQLAAQQAELKRQQQLLQAQIQQQRREQERLVAQQKAQAAAHAAAQERARQQEAQKAEHLKRLQELQAQRDAQAKAAAAQKKQEAELQALEEQKKKLHAQRMQLLAQQRQAQAQAKQLALLRQQQVQQQQQSYLSYQNLFGKQPLPATMQQLPNQQQLLTKPSGARSGTHGSLTQGHILIPPKLTGQNQPSFAGGWQPQTQKQPQSVLRPGQAASQIFPPFFSNNHQTGLGSRTLGNVRTLSSSSVQQSQFPLRSIGGAGPRVAGSVAFPQGLAALKRSSRVLGKGSDVSLEAQPCSVLSPPKAQLLSGPPEDGGATFFMCIPGVERTKGVWAKLRCPRDSTFSTEKQICL